MTLTKYISKTYLQCAGIMALMVWVLGLLLDFSFVVRPMYYVRCIMDGSVLALPVLFVPVRAKKPVAIALCIILALILVLNYGYYQFFESAFPLKFFKLGGRFDTVIIQGSLKTLKTSVFIFVPLLLLFFISQGVADKHRWKVLTAVVVANALTIGFEYCVSVVNLKIRNQLVYNRFNPEDYYDGEYVTANGIVPFVMFAVNWKELFDNQKYDYKNIDATSLPQYTDNSFAYAKGKNLIILFVESLNDVIINYKIDDKEICPNLNRIYNDSTNISAKFKPHYRTASDGAHMIVTTGVPTLPDKFTWNYVTKDFPSLVKTNLWKESVLVTTDVEKYYYLNVMNTYYGYEQQIYREAIQKDLNIERVLEKEVFDYTVKNIGSWQEPFIAQLSTIAMHGPFKFISESEKEKWIMNATDVDEVSKDYFACVKYFDDCLGDFLQKMKALGKYDDSVIAIMGDHCTHKGYGNFLYNQGDSSAIVILNSGCPVERIPRPKHMQQIDIYPTLLDLIGGNGYGWKGLGCSIFRGDEVRDDASRYTLSRQLILSDYFLHHDFKE